MSSEVNTESIAKHYLEQCMSIKKEIYDLLAKQHREANERHAKYIVDAEEIAAILEPLMKEASLVKTELKDAIKASKKEMEKEFVKLKEQYEFGSICINTITKRMDDLESYIKNERFHDIVKEINDLESRFEQEAMKLVQKRMKEKK